MKTQKVDCQENAKAHGGGTVRACNDKKVIISHVRRGHGRLPTKRESRGIVGPEAEDGKIECCLRLEPTLGLRDHGRYVTMARIHDVLRHTNHDESRLVQCDANYAGL
jgi:hypothetical protein